MASATLVETADDPEIELSFGYHEQGQSGQLLRDWVKRLPGVAWDRRRKCWRITDPEILPPGELRRVGIVVTRENGTPAKRHEVIPAPVAHDPPPTTDPDELCVPASFGLALMEDQERRARLVASGHWLECSVPGTGKTRVILAAAAILGAGRIVVCCPPVVVTHWYRETVQSGVAEASVPPPRSVNASATSTSLPAGAAVVRITAGRKEPALPEHGVVVVPDSLLAARPALVAQLVAWQPDLFVVDEAHREMSWHSARSRACRRLARAARRVICATGTPMFAQPTQMAPMLAMTGQLEGVFGGRLDFCDRYARVNRFGEWAARKQRLPELRKILDDQVWVRCESNPHLPELSRWAKFVDVDTAAYDQAYADVVAKIDEWLDDFCAESGRPPDEDERAAFAADNLGFVSQLRRAAGLVKVPAAAEMVAEWVVANPDRPLVVWTHHKAVTAAMAAAVPGTTRVEVIDGQTTGARRDRIIDGFQAGGIGVLVCQITAAGVGITLTRSSDALFVETDWTPDLVTQAEARLHRIGQRNHVRCTTLIAPGTLDETIHGVLQRKIEVLGLLMPERDSGVSVHSFADAAGVPSVSEARKLGAVDTRAILLELIERRVSAS